MRRLALARPELAFTLSVDGRAVLRAEPARRAVRRRAAAPAGHGDGPRVRRQRARARRRARRHPASRGYAGLPTFSRRDAARSICSSTAARCRTGCCSKRLRGAYSDLLFHDRQPVAALFLELPPELVDVNVHPAKAEVRFRDPALVRGLVIGALKRALAEHGHRSAAAGTRCARRASAPARHRAPAGPGRAAPAPGDPGLLQAALAVGAPAARARAEPADEQAAASAGRRAGPAAPKLDPGRDRGQPDPGRPARGARADRLRAAEGRAARRWRAAPGAAAARGGRARPRRP